MTRRIRALRGAWERDVEEEVLLSAPNSQLYARHMPQVLPEIEETVGLAQGEAIDGAQDVSPLQPNGRNPGVLVGIADDAVTDPEAVGVVDRLQVQANERGCGASPEGPLEGRAFGMLVLKRAGAPHQRVERRLVSGALLGQPVGVVRTLHTQTRLLGARAGGKRRPEREHAEGEGPRSVVRGRRSGSGGGGHQLQRVEALC